MLLMIWRKLIPGAGMVINALQKRAQRKHAEKIAEIKLEGAKEIGEQKATLAIAEVEALRAKSPYSWPQILFMFLFSFIVIGAVGHFLYGIYIYAENPLVLEAWSVALNLLEGVPTVLGLIISVILSMLGGAVLANRLIK